MKEANGLEQKIINILKDNDWIAYAIDSLTVGSNGKNVKILENLAKLITELGENNARSKVS